MPETLLVGDRCGTGKYGGRVEVFLTDFLNDRQASFKTENFHTHRGLFPVDLSCFLLFQFVQAILAFFNREVRKRWSP